MPDNRLASFQERRSHQSRWSLRREQLSRGNWAHRVGRILASLIFFGVATEGHAQLSGFEPSGPVSIPLQYWNGATKLAIFVGINGGAPLPYVFDTGSPVFNAVYNSTWWPGVGPSVSSLPGWDSTLPAGQNVQFCLGGSSTTEGHGSFCRGYTGNLVQVPLLSFYDSATASRPFAELATGTGPNQGYVINAAYNYARNGGPFSTSSPPLDGYFFGTFGAGNFGTNAQVVGTNWKSPEKGPYKDPNYYAGGVLGQTIVSGVMAQGYVVAANGQPNPVSSNNPPQQSSGVNVTIRGETVPVTRCSPCAIVGLTPEILGQFWASPPTLGGNAGVIPWAETGAGPFQNPYGGAEGNNSSTERGTNYQTTLIPKGADSPAIVERLPGLLDSGTTDLNLRTNASQSQIDRVSSSGPGCLQTSCAVNNGVTLTVAGVDPAGRPIPGLQPTTMRVTDNTSRPDATYNAHLNNDRNTIGIAFFLQNSVMYDLTHRVTSYTPFFVTDASLTTTAGGPLIIDSDNVWLGLAGVVSGAGGVTIDAGGKVQFSAINTYTGPTQIFKGGELLVSGPGSIRSSSGVLNDGVFDISRAWSAVSIQNITGSGDVYLGGRNLVITNASGVVSGRILDGGGYLGYPGTGGGLTLAGGVLTLSGVNTYKGPTNVVAGTLLVDAGSNTGSGVTTVFRDAALGGAGAIGGALANHGLLRPGPVHGGGVGALTVNGDLTFAPGSIYGVQIDAAGGADRTAVKGTTSIDGGQVVVSSDAWFNRTRLLTTPVSILSSARGVSGRFDGLTDLASYSFLTPTLLYGRQDVSLGYQLTPFNIAGRTINQRNVGAALTLGAFGSFLPQANNVFNSLYYGGYQSAPNVMETVGGAGLAGVQTAAMGIGQLATSAVSDQIAFWRSGSNLDPMGVASRESGDDYVRGFMAYAADEPGGATKAPVTKGRLVDLVAPPSLPRTFRAWGSMFGGAGNFSADVSRGAPGANTNYYGGLLGVDYQLTPNALIGAALGGSNAWFNVGSLSTAGNLTGFHAGIYGAYTMGASYLALNETFSLYTNQANRSAGGYLLLPYERLSANFGSTEFRTRLEVGHSLQFGELKATPFLAAEFAAYQSSPFMEQSSLFSQSSLSLRNNGQSVNSVPAFIGLRLSNAYSFVNGWRLLPVGSVAYIHEFSPNRQLTNMLLSIPGPEFNVAGPRSTYNLVQAKIGAQLFLNTRFALFTDFQGEFSSASQSYGGKGGLKYFW